MSLPDQHGLLAPMQAGDVDKVKGCLERHPEILAEHKGLQAHPLLVGFVETQAGHCYKDQHLRIAELFLRPEVRNFRDSVVADDVVGTAELVAACPELVTAEFTAGRGIAQALHHFRSVRMGELLIDLGADLEALSSLKETPLYMQVRFGTPSTLELLLTRGAVPSCGERDLMPASQHMEEMLKLLAAHAWSAATAGGSLLHDAKHGHGKRIAMWLEYGVDPNVRGPEGQTALHLLAARGTGREAIEALIMAGADPGALDSMGRSPLDLATSAKSQVAAKALRSVGGKASHS